MKEVVEKYLIKISQNWITWILRWKVFNNGKDEMQSVREKANLHAARNKGQITHEELVIEHKSH
jgi:hypothetical protein